MLRQCSAKCNACDAQEQKIDVQKLFFYSGLERHITRWRNFKGGNLMENYILMIEKELSQAFKELSQPRSRQWNWRNAHSHISILCPNSSNHFSIHHVKL